MHYYYYYYYNYYYYICCGSFYENKMLLWLVKEPGSYFYRASRDLAKLRIIRSAKIVIYFDSARIMVECIARAAKELLFVSILILLFAYIYAVFGCAAFNYMTIEPDANHPLNFPKSFDTVLDSLKCMWQIFTNDHWLAVLFDARQVETLRFWCRFSCTL